MPVLKEFLLFHVAEKAYSGQLGYLYIYSCLGIYMVIIVCVVTILPYMVTVVPLHSLKSIVHVTLAKLRCFICGFGPLLMLQDKQVETVFYFSYPYLHVGHAQQVSSLCVSGKFLVVQCSGRTPPAL